MLLALIVAAGVQPGWLQRNPDWVEPVEPLELEEGVYYVGTRGLSSFLLTTPKGHVLIDSGLVEMPPLVAASIEKLGFKVRDVKVIVPSHAHFDHVGGMALMQRLTGAEVMAVGEDARALATGVDNSALQGPGWEPVKVARVLKDGETVTVGSRVLTAHLTAGHTRGCTSWSTPLPRGLAVFVCSLTVNDDVKLRGNALYQAIGDDYLRSLATLRSLPAQYFFASHPYFFHLEEKRKAGKGFIDPAGYAAYLDGAEKKIKALLE